ncbi:hypothetical protein [Tsukamurella sp. USMM236]|uniref:hypothetical protein n=1 Tax=Tsukamurella sp. USMM236 TaxID=3081301 RepID=UPI0030165537
MKKALISSGLAIVLAVCGGVGATPAANASGPCTLKKMVTGHWEASTASPSTTLWPGTKVDVSMFTETNSEGTWTPLVDGAFKHYVLDFWEFGSCE